MTKTSEMKAIGTDAGALKSWAGRIFGLVVALMLATALPAAAQDNAQAQGQGGGDQAQNGPPWSTRCSSNSREAAPDCQIEQRAVVTETGQLLLLVTIGVSGNSREPMMTVRTPLQLFLPAGVAMDIDGRDAAKIDYQTCDQSGCYARMPVSNGLLEAMFKGLKLNITLETMARQKVQVPMSLSGFTEVYNRIR
ncbi:invasion associated locus B family protein [Amorphus sp. 3PC139-8]|uniref:invasion associated locus B family protein n=1 Tax=Amorphus sp. 3PC139-8 TaxID=2735676 RepID=UPI00345DA801